MKEGNDESGHDDVTILAGRKAVEPPKQENLTEPESKAEQPENVAESGGHDEVTVLASSFAEKLRQAESAQEKTELPTEVVEDSIAGEGEPTSDEPAPAEERPVEPLPPAHEVSEPIAGEAPPPPVPPSDTTAGKPGKSNKTILIIVIVVAVVLCCCCVAMLVILWVTGAFEKVFGASIMKMMEMAGLLTG